MNDLPWNGHRDGYRSTNLIEEIVVDANLDDERVWVPLADGVALRPMMFDCTNGAWSSLLRIAPGKSLACHYRGAILSTTGYPTPAPTSSSRRARCIPWSPTPRRA